METLVKIGVVLAIIGGIVFGFNHWKSGIEDAADKRGYDRRQAEWVVAEAGIKLAAETEAAKGLMEANAKTAAIQAKFDQGQVDRLKEKKNAEEKLAGHVAAALAGTERLSFDTGRTGCAIPAEGKAGDPASPAGSAGEARTYVLPGVAAAILRIARDSSSLVRDFNDVVEAYNSCRATANSD